jgi:hypothetical protein
MGFAVNRGSLWCAVHTGGWRVFKGVRSMVFGLFGCVVHAVEAEGRAYLMRPADRFRGSY